MTDEMRDEIVKELQFNAKYLADKYDLDNVLILSSSLHKEEVTDYNAAYGNMYTNTELCRKHIREQEIVYDEQFN